MRPGVQLRYFQEPIGYSQLSPYHTVNEDRFCAVPANAAYEGSLPFMAVLDGVGGKANGAHASEVAKVALENQLHLFKGVSNLNDAITSMRRLLIGAHREIIESQPEPGKTVVVATQIVPINKQLCAVVGNAGDGRVNLIRSGRFRSLTLDHSASDRYVQGKITSLTRTLSKSVLEMRRRRLVKEQLFFSEIEDTTKLSMRQKEVFDNRHLISSYLGSTKKNFPIIRTDVYPLQPGDILVLTSDGIHDNLTNTEQENYANYYPTRQLPEELVMHSLQRMYSHHPRRKPDDATAVVWRY